MNARWVRWLTTVLVMFLSCPLPPAQAAKTKSTKSKKKAPPVETQEKTWLPAELTFGFQTRDSETEGLGDLLVPLWNPGGKGLLFVNPRAAISDDDEEEGNLGVGYRQLLGNQVILGANAYYDYRDVDSNHYDQWGVGFEILSTWIDARANYYDAGGDRNVVDSRTETSTSQSRQTTAGWNDPYALDHYVLQDYATTRTLTTITTSRTFEQFEAAYGGYDWEIGLRLPIQSTALEARLFGGYYDFDRDFSSDVRGWKTRAELRVLSTLFLDAGLYEDDELTGSDWFAGARLAVPLDLSKIARGRNPFATAKSRLAREPRDLSARLTEMVMRDSQIRIETSDFIENESLATEEITRKSHTDRETYVMMSDVNFVDGDEGAVTGDGTAEHPYATIQQGVDAVFGTRNVYVYDARSAYVENVVLTPGVRLWGSGALVTGGANGATFGSGIAPVVDGGGTGPAITLADGTTVLGFRVQNTGAGGAGVFVDLPVRGLTDVSGIGILGNGATDLTLLDNVVSGNGIGILLARQGDFLLDFENNLVSGNAANGMEVWTAGNSGTCEVFVADSTFANNGADGLQISSSTYDRFYAFIQDSAFANNGGSGIDVSMANAEFAGVEFSNVVARQNAQMGIDVAVQNADEAAVILLGTQAGRNGAGGVAADLTGVGNSMIIAQNAVFDQNAGHGIFTTQTISDEAWVQMSGVQANGNASVGIEIAQSAADLSVAGVSNSVANDNAGLGLMLAQGNTLLAVAAVGGLQANGNASGLNLHQTDVGIALANVSDSCADENAQYGMWILQDSDLASINVVGMPDGLATSIDGIAGLLGLELPDEIMPFLGPSGGVSASGNGIGGLRATSCSDGLLALNGLFDATANDNVAGDGISATAFATNGIGVNLAGSSENWADIFQLGTQIGDLFDVDLPLALAGDGHLQANGNGASGIVLGSFGGLAAANLTIGAEASGNGVAGLVSISTGFEISIDAIARLEALDNGHCGLYQSTWGIDVAAIGLLADVNASGNGTDPLLDGGICSDVYSPNGVAALLAFSSDALRPAAAFLGEEFLGAAFEIPGEAFGPVVASDNVGSGFRANVEGDVAAAAALLDVQANNNAANGIDLSLLSDDGLTVSLLASSDLLYDVLPGVFDADPIAGVGLGPVSACYNGGGGIVIEQNGWGPAYGLLAGVEANNNVANDGILASLTSANGSVGAFLVDVEASFNAAGCGIDLDLAGYDDVLAGLVYVEAENNGQQGIRVVGDSDDGDAFALLAGIDANRNGALGNLAGIVLDLTADEDASAALTDVYARNNAGRGANVLLDAGIDANLFAGDFAADDLDAVYGYSGDLGSAFDLIPTGNDVFSDNGSGGLHVGLTSANGDALVGISGVNADYNVNAGFNLALNALNGSTLVGIEGAYANHNGANGINLGLNGTGGIADVLLNRVGVNGNDANGIQIVENYDGAVGVVGENIVATSNSANGVRLAMSGLAGAPILDFGGGGVSPGQSSFFGNGNRDFRYNNGGGGIVMAENNWWGADQDPVANGQTVGVLSSNVAPWLAAAP